MSTRTAGLVQIARDFLEAHAVLTRLFEDHRNDRLRFEALAELVGDDANSLLFRLKERCHTSFRSEPGDDEAPIHREALFDLAVGSLFHEAMKFRENVYQSEIYGPRVQALRTTAGEEEAALFDEFARIQEGVAARIQEGLRETEVLLARTLDQLRRLLESHNEDPLVARFLFIHARAVEAAFGRDFPEVLVDIYGDAALGYERAGKSLLAGGYYEEAIGALTAALHTGGDARLESLVAYAQGMEAYLARDYATCVTRLSRWAGEGAMASETLARLARDAVARIRQLADGPTRDRVSDDAAELLEQLGS